MDDDDENKQSADDALESQNDMNDLEHDEEIGSPAAPPTDIHSSAPLDDPSTDDGVDPDELYQEGIKGATNADDEEIEPDNRPRPLEPED